MSVITVRRVRLSRLAGLGMLGLGIGYFLWYTPYSGLAKALAGGLLPGTDGPVGGLVLLPSAALGTLVAMPVFLLASGWWRHARTRRIAGREVPFPGRETAASAFWMALVVGTTTLNFTFVGFSIVFMLVMMRIETILLAPTVDLIRGRSISPYSWAAITLSLIAGLIAFADVSSYRLSLAAFASLAAYLIGYSGRFAIMSKHAKTGEPVDRRYFVEEHMTTPIALVAILAVPAIINQGSAMHALRVGFTSFLTEPAAAYGFAIGVFYEGLFIFTTLIFLDRREYAFCMPVHVCASLLAGIAASTGLRFIFGTPAASSAQLLSAVFVVLAALALSYPAISARLWARPPRLLLFVCGGNVSRSPMAEAFARAELAGLPRRTARQWSVRSAGLTVDGPGSPMAPEAVEAVSRLGVASPPHASNLLTAELCEEGVAVFCMTEAQRQAVLALAPSMKDKTFRLDPEVDIDDPTGSSVDGYVECARHIRQVVRSRLWETVASRPSRLAAATAAAGTGA